MNILAWVRARKVCNATVCRGRTRTFAGGLAVAFSLSTVGLFAQQSADIKVTATVAANCTIVAADLAFGAYDPLSGPQVDRTATITLTCTQGSTARVTLDNGGNYSTTRRMAGGTPAGFLNYALYTDTGRATAWNSQQITVSSFDATNKATLTVYGRVPAGQSTVAVGSYTDTVKATVNF